MDKFIVRFAAIALTVYMIAVTALAFYVVDISEYDYLFTDSFIIGLVLTTLCHTQGKYHCVWMRAMCYNLTIVPLINFFDCKYPIFETAESYVYFIGSCLALTVLSTLILAINHFRKVRKLKKQRYKEYAVRFRK